MKTLVLIVSTILLTSFSTQAQVGVNDRYVTYLKLLGETQMRVVQLRTQQKIGRHDPEKLRELEAEYSNRLRTLLQGDPLLLIKPEFSNVIFESEMTFRPENMGIVDAYLDVVDAIANKGKSSPQDILDHFRDSGFAEAAKKYLDIPQSELLAYLEAKVDKIRQDKIQKIRESNSDLELRKLILPISKSFHASHEAEYLWYSLVKNMDDAMKFEVAKIFFSEPIRTATDAFAALLIPSIDLKTWETESPELFRQILRMAAADRGFTSSATGDVLGGMADKLRKNHFNLAPMVEGESTSSFNLLEQLYMTYERFRFGISYQSIRLPKVGPTIMMDLIEFSLREGFSKPILSDLYDNEAIMKSPRFTGLIELTSKMAPLEFRNVAAGLVKQGALFKLETPDKAKLLNLVFDTLIEGTKAGHETSLYGINSFMYHGAKDPWIIEQFINSWGDRMLPLLTDPRWLDMFTTAIYDHPKIPNETRVRWFEDLVLRPKLNPKTSIVLGQSIGLILDPKNLKDPNTYIPFEQREGLQLELLEAATEGRHLQQVKKCAGLF